MEGGTGPRAGGGPPSLLSDALWALKTPFSVLAADFKAAASHVFPSIVAPHPAHEPAWTVSYARRVATSRSLLDIDENEHSVERIRGLEKFRDKVIHISDFFVPAAKRAERWILGVHRTKLDELQRTRNGGIPDSKGVLDQPSLRTWTLPSEIQEPTSEHHPSARSQAEPDEVASISVEYVPVPDTPTKSRRDSLGTPPKLIVLVPGGGLAFGSATGVRPFARGLAALHEAPVLSVSYRKPPEHAFPSGIRDIAALLGYLTGSLPSDVFDGTTSIPLYGKYRPKEIMLYANSAGGGVLLSSLLYMDSFLPRNESSISPRDFYGAVLVSPWLDLRCSSSSWKDNLETDILPHFLRDGIHGKIYKGSRNPVAGYLEGHGGSRTGWRRSSDTLIDAAAEPHPLSEDLLSHPLISPALAPPELAERALPPLLLLSGSRETLLDDARMVHLMPARTSWIIFESMCHDFRMHEGTQSDVAGGWERTWMQNLEVGQESMGTVFVGLGGRVKHGEIGEAWGKGILGQV